MSDNPPTDPYTQELRLQLVPKPTVQSMTLDKLDDTSLEVAHLSNKLEAFTAYLVEMIVSSKWLLTVLVISLVGNTLLLIALLVAVSFLFGAMR